MVVAAETADGHRRIVLANAAARAAFRLSGDAPMLVAAIRRPELLEIVDAGLISEEPGEAVFELDERMLHAFVRPLDRSADGHLQVLLSVRDETDARRNERMRADFLANASHELRTPLASMTGFIETLRGHAKDDPEAQDRFLGIMAVQADRMGRLIADLMSLSRIELNEHVPPEGDADLAGVAADVIDAVAPLAQAAKVRIELTSPSDGSALVPGDRDQLVQVVQNMVDNALKYSPAGGVVGVEIAPRLSADQAVEARGPAAARLSLLTPSHAPNALYVAVSVSDQGPGIEREHLPRLTERFYRAPGQKSGERSGTGLGLAIVKHILNRHRGGLAVESAPGRGARFIAYLPMTGD